MKESLNEVLMKSQQITNINDEIRVEAEAWDKEDKEF